MLALPAHRLDESPIANDWTLAFTHHLTREAAGYWERCRGDRTMPTAEDLTVRGMKNFISHVALIEVQSRLQGGLDFRIRLVGESTKRVFGDVSGKSFGEFLSPEGEKRWRYGAEAVCERKTRLRKLRLCDVRGQALARFRNAACATGRRG